MKYIITESKLENLIFDYLDNQNFYVIHHMGDIYFSESEQDWKSGGYAIIGYHKKHNDVFISSELIEKISNIFGLDINYVMDIINNWIMYKYDVKDSTPYSDFGSD